MRLSPPDTIVDWTLFGLVIALAGTGLWTGVAAIPSTWWVFALHGGLALVFAVFLAWKLRRVATRLRPREWDRGTKTSVVVGALALAALGTGVAWTWGAPVWVGGVSVVTIHAVLGLLVVPAVLLHLRHRYHGIRTGGDTGRRTAIRVAVIGGLAAIGWRLQRRIAAVAGLVVRFTGSRLRGTHSGNAYPRTEWAADDPAPIGPDEWTVTIEGAVHTERTFDPTDIPDATATEAAVLDCTSGWYTVQDWRGVRLTELLETVSPTDGATHVSIVSVTGYRWTFSLDAAEDLLLATHVEDERLNHAHGYPLRLVAPGHRGYRWVKWVETIRLRRTPDPGKWVAIFVSGFD